MMPRLVPQRRLTIVMMQHTPAPRSLPAPSPPVARALRHSRPLRGEILCDETGELYERMGQYVRRVHHLVSGPRGELLDVNPAGVVEWNPPESAAMPPPAGDRPAEPAPSAQTATPAAAAVRLLLAPGTRRTAPFGEIKPLVRAQLAHPDRLRDSHHLSCFVQVVEAVRAQPIAALVPPHPSGRPSRAAIERLTPALARLFGLDAVARPLRGEAGRDEDARPGERFLLLQVAGDPTAERDPGTRHARVAVPAPRRTIAPERLRPWEFVRSREEAELDAAVDRSRGVWARAWRALRRRVFDRAGWRRWRGLLAGRSLDDQLWSIRPPRGSLVDPQVRAWAHEHLARGGYDVPLMTREWEIFWRRKGL